MKSEEPKDRSWEEEFDSAFDWIEEEKERCKIMYGFTSETLKDFIHQLLKETQDKTREEIESKDSAYRERDMLVAALSKLFPSYLARHPDEDKTWENDWRWIVYIELPSGQVSWHIHDDEKELFSHLGVQENRWDGHNTERKYQRLSALDTITNQNKKL